MKTKRFSLLLFMLLTIVPCTMKAQIEFSTFRFYNDWTTSGVLGLKASYKITSDKPIKKWYLKYVFVDKIGDVGSLQEIVNAEAYGEYVWKQGIIGKGPFKPKKSYSWKNCAVIVKVEDYTAFPYMLCIAYMDNTVETINIRKNNFKKFFPNNKWIDVDYRGLSLNDGNPFSTTPIQVNQDYAEVTEEKETIQQPASQPTADEIDTDIPTVQTVNNNTFAVIFANEDYQEVAHVDYAQNDGETFKKYCNLVLGIPEKNIHLRTNATKNNMIAEMAWMSGVADAYNGEAKFIVYYAGHGVPDEKLKNAYLLPVDGLATNPATAYSLASFYKELGSLDAARVTVFMDACFSGSQRGEGMLASARGVVVAPRKEAPAGKMVVFSAAQGDETAYPYKEKGHGLFTYFLLKKLRESKGNCTLQELGEFIQSNVKRQSIVVNNKTQTPGVSASQQLATSWKTMKLK